MHRFRYFAPVAGWALFILVVSIVPSDELPETDFRLADKAAHLFVYGVLSFLAILDYCRFSSQSFLSFSRYVLIFILASSYGIILEIIQETFIPSRYGEVNDALANGLGAFFGVVLGGLWKK